MKTKNNILLNKFVQLVEQNHSEITEHFMNDLLKNPNTAAYHSLDRSIIHEISDKIYRDLSIWIGKEYPKEKIEERYTKIGQERFEQGIPFPQVQKAMVLQKRHLWLYVINKINAEEHAYEEALELNNRVTLYFDRATFHMLRGYEHMLRKNF